MNLKILLAILVLSSCSTFNKKTVIQTNTENINTQVEHGDIFTIDNCVGCSSKDSKGVSYNDKNKKAKSIIQEIVNGKCFSDNFLSSELIDNKDLSNEAVLGIIRTNHVNIDLEMYYKRFSNVHGYTKPFWKVIKLNKKYHYSYGNCSSAANLGHEVNHKQGFSHSFKPTPDRPKSVPYTVGRIINLCCEKKYGKDY